MWSKSSSTSIVCVCDKRRLRLVCACAMRRLMLVCAFAQAMSPEHLSCVRRFPTMWYLGPSINGLVTDGNTKLCCRGLVLVLFESTTTNKLILSIHEIIRDYSTPASNLGYLAPPRTFFMGAKLFIGTPWMGNEGVLKKLVWAM